jgi:HEAT repeat protein
VRGADTEGVELRLALELAAASAVLAWLSVSLVTVVGRAGYEHRRRTALPRLSGPRRERRLLRRAGRHRGEAAKWRRIAALRELARERHPRSRQLLALALVDPDRDVAAAAVRAFGDLGDSRAVEALVDALRHGRAPRSRVATQLERLTPRIGPRLVQLLDEPDPGVRFWAATLLSGCPDVGRYELLARTGDPDPNVRAAAVEALGERGESAALQVVRERLEDPAWFVRVHASRALGRLGSPADAPALAAGLRDSRWWVRAAAKDALRDLGPGVAATLLPYLEDADAFARNGAAEVLQDIGFVDALGPGAPERELLERILAAGGEGLREAARRRAVKAEDGGREQAAAG